MHKRALQFQSCRSRNIETFVTVFSEKVGKVTAKKQCFLMQVNADDNEFSVQIQRKMHINKGGILIYPIPVLTSLLFLQCLKILIEE